MEETKEREDIENLKKEIECLKKVKEEKIMQEESEKITEKLEFLEHEKFIQNSEKNSTFPYKESIKFVC